MKSVATDSSLQKIIITEIEKLWNYKDDYNYSKRVYKLKLHQMCNFIIKLINNNNNSDDENIVYITFTYNMIIYFKNELKDRSYYENVITHYFSKRRINKLIEYSEEQIIESFHDYVYKLYYQGGK